MQHLSPIVGAAPAVPSRTAFAMRRDRTSASTFVQHKLARQNPRKTDIVARRHRRRRTVSTWAVTTLPNRVR